MENTGDCWRLLEITRDYWKLQEIGGDQHSITSYAMACIQGHT